MPEAGLPTAALVLEKDWLRASSGTAKNVPPINLIVPGLAQFLKQLGEARSGTVSP